MIKSSQIWSFLHKPVTLRSKIMKAFIINFIITFVCLSFTSNYAISSILTNKIESGIQRNLKQVQLSLENTIKNLNHVSHQLSHQGMTGKRLYEYILSSEPYDRLKLISEITTELNFITFTNPNIGLVMYYFKNDDNYMFENYSIKDDFNIDKLPLLAEYHTISFYGPHISNKLNNDKYVLSALRKVEMAERDDVFIYVETSFDLTENILDIDNGYRGCSYLIIDNNGFIAYSALPDIFPVNSLFDENIENNDSGTYRDYYWYKATSNQGWSILSVIHKDQYYSERNKWIRQMTLFSLFLMFFNLSTAWLVWQTIRKPLNAFSKEIKWLTEKDFISKSEETNILEFDYLLDTFNKMKQQILSLIKEIEQKEKNRANLEIEKLRYQINPHFLMNTLNTAQWMAIMNNQDSISNLLQSLNRLLYHNLGKMDQPTTLQEEINSIKEYLNIQNIRYDFTYDIEVKADKDTMDMLVPRFILQPLVENAIHHGLKDNGNIYVEVNKLNNTVEILIQDDGPGMPQDIIEEIMTDVKDDPDKIGMGKTGMGIGTNYVKRMIEIFYEGQATMEIHSKLGKGTKVILKLPIYKGEEK